MLLTKRKSIPATAPQRLQVLVPACLHEADANPKPSAALHSPAAAWRSRTWDSLMKALLLPAVPWWVEGLLLEVAPSATLCLSCSLMRSGY